MYRRRYRRSFRRGRFGGRRNGRQMFRRPELKFLDTTEASFTPATTGNVSATVVQARLGTGSSQRIGRQIAVRSIHVKLMCVLPTTTAGANASDSMSVWVVLDKQCNGATFTFANLFGSDILDHRNLDNVRRFKVLKKVSFNIAGAGFAGDGTTNDVGNRVKYFEIHLSNVYIPIDFDADAGTIADMTSNNIAVVTVSQLGVATMAFITRIRYSE